MLFASWLGKVQPLRGSMKKQRNRPARRKQGSGQRPMFELLEDRITPTGSIYGLVPGNPADALFNRPASPGKVVRIDAATGAEATVWQGADKTNDGPYGGGGAAAEPNGTVVFAGFMGGKGGLYALDPAASQPAPTLLDANAYNALVASASGNVPGVLQFSPSGYDANESGGGIAITVNRVSGSSGAVSIHYTTADGSASAGKDYTAESGTLSWADGDSNPKSFTVPVLDDGGSGEANETFNVLLSAPGGGASLGTPGSAVVTIHEDNGVAQPGQLQFSAPTYTIREDGGSVSITVTRTSGTSGAVSIHYATADGTAAAGAKYTAASGTLSFADGETSKSFTVPILEENVIEGTTTFSVALSSPTGGATLGNQATAVVNIHDDDGTANQQYVARAFLDILQRPADPDGLAAWSGYLDQGGQRFQVAAALSHGAEYYTNVIKSVYQRYLGRQPDGPGLDAWLAAMQGGLSDERLEAGFIGSAEYVQDHGGQGAGWVRGMYLDLLGRAASDAEVQAWVNALNSGVRTTDVAYGFAASDEREGQRVTADYEKFLGRDPEPGVVATSWLPYFRQGGSNEDIIAAFAGSDEYFHRSTGP